MPCISSALAVMKSLQRWESNPGPLGGKRERYRCAMPTLQVMVHWLERMTCLQLWFLRAWVKLLALISKVFLFLSSIKIQGLLKSLGLVFLTNTIKDKSWVKPEWWLCHLRWPEQEALELPEVGRTWWRRCSWGRRSRRRQSRRRVDKRVGKTEASRKIFELGGSRTGDFGSGDWRWAPGRGKTSTATCRIARPLRDPVFSPLRQGKNRFWNRFWNKFLTRHPL